MAAKSATEKGGETDAASADVAVIKKYANRRLYNKATSSYVTLDELSQMVRAGEDFVVFDAKSGEDITRSVLTQIILEEDSKGRNLLPISFLRQIISYYDDSLHAFLPRYLEVSMENFSNNQDQMRQYIEGTLGQFFPVSQFEDMARQNMAMFQRAATMFSPFASGEPGANPVAGKPADAPKTGANPPGSTEVQELREKLDALQRQLNGIADNERGTR